ncbi:solute carrier family 12 member 2-like [Ornithodoros turicata]|uniref:Putative sodium-potassium-chloride cotransporter n=1 Tax=Ornithodoros turicata TaxID=34597 RepID=A0A2R5LFZ6_9ACAR
MTERSRSRFQVAKVDYVNEALATDDEIASSESPNCVITGASMSPTDPANYTTVYDTANVKSLLQYTHEALPRVDHYRNVMSVHGHISRPTLDELHYSGRGSTAGLRQSLSIEGKPEEMNISPAVKFGWIQGVLVRCLLNIWGVMLFLRLSWVVGQAGIGLAVAVILLASTVTMLTTLSMSAICTNGEVRGGGTYYMISRSLGPEFGGAIGLIFALANAVAVAMYVVGFAETVQAVMGRSGMFIVDADMNDIRIISCATVVVLLCIALVGTEWESKAQVGLLVILLSAMVDFVVGSFLPPTEDQIEKGFLGWSGTIGLDNFSPDFRKGESFFSVFSVFFPAATGILAGANISGDLRDPQKAIPKGTLLAIFITTLSYVGFAIIAGLCVVRDASGFYNGTDPEIVINELANCTGFPEDSCPYGLMNYFQVMEMVSAYGPLVIAGVFAATLSSALASLVSAPKVFQALCNDKLFPYIHWFGKGYGKNNEPRRGYVLAFGISLACCAIGELNAIAPIISNFFLAAYCLINFSCFHASFTRMPGFRPAFRYYNLWASLLGAILCLSVMFVTNWPTALGTFAIILGLYIFIYHRKPDVNWGSSTQAQTYLDALNSVVKLNTVKDHVKNYRPQLLVLTGNPVDRLPLVDFAHLLTKKLSLMICGEVRKPPMSHRVRHSITSRAYRCFERRKVKSFFTLVEDESFSHGVSSLIQIVGVGKLRPNVVLMGYKASWQTCPHEELQEYFATMHNAYDSHMALCILRLAEGLDYSMYANLEEALSETVENSTPQANRRDASSTETLTRNASSSQVSQAGSSGDEASLPRTPTMERNNRDSGLGSCHKAATTTAVTMPDSDVALPKVDTTPKRKSMTSQVLDLAKTIPKNVLHSVNQFQRKQKKGTIDVWWLYDDGGLTMLLPYLLSTRSQFSNCKLRVFALANKKYELDQEQRNMAELLSKFRIDYSDVMLLADIVMSPQEATKQEFQKLLKPWRRSSRDAEAQDLSAPYVTDSEIIAMKEKTYRNLRLHELLRQHSTGASLVVMTLPMPRKGTCSAPMYMAWLEMLTRDMPPFLLIRGNQTSVLTFYS